ncbi:MAG: LTA synthase family protein [Weissella hellenica]|uniref:LTA synthase family protein n=1 Tax=Weissella hellenica TaxID=46256 RepID=UPI003F9B63FD
MKRKFQNLKLTSPILNGWMRILLIGLIFSICTTVLLQFAMYFQTWGRFDQTTDIGQAFQAACRFMERPQAFFSVLVSLILFIFIIVLTNHLFVGIATYWVLVIVAFVAEYMKMKARNEPILFSDLSEVTAVGGLTQMVDKTLLFGAMVVILVLVILVVVLETCILKKRTSRFAESVHGMMFQKMGERLLTLCMSIVLLGTPFLVSADSNRALLEHFGYEWQSFNTGDDTMINGPVMTFVSNIATVIMREPSGYSAKSMAKIDQKYEKYAAVLNKTRTNDLSGQTVITLLSESLTNPDKVENLKYTGGADVYKNIKQLKKNAVMSGTMLSSGYGGGTANIEYMTLAGFPLSMYAPEMVVPYGQLVPFANKVPTLPGLFDKREVIHPYVGTFYNRRDAYKKMSIQKFYTTDGQKYKYPSSDAGTLGKSVYTADKNAYRYLLKKIAKSSNKDSQFLQLMTMQNHMPYEPGEYGNSKYKVTSPTLSDTARKQIETYITGVHYSDVATKKLVAKLDKMQRPVTMIFYGDHWPGVFTFVDPNKQKERSHETDYFIYQNKAARQQSKQTFNQHERAYASPSDFPALALQATNSKVSPLFALQTKIVNELPAFANYQRGRFVDNNGNQLSTKDLTKKQKALLHDLKLVQYDLSSGEHYLKNSFTK